MKVKLIIISIILLLVMVFAIGCTPIMEKLGLVNPTDEEQLSPEKGGPPDGLVKVLIGFKEKPGPAQQAMVKGVGGKIKYTYHIVDAIAASIPEKAIDALQKNPNVTHVELDGEIFAMGQTLPWGVDRIDAEEVWTDYTGQGVNVAIIDSGIDNNHFDLIVKGGVNFVSTPSWKIPDPDKWDDDYGHGTHVAGIVAALDNDIGVVGVAPKADLYALKVLDRTGRGNYSDVIAALEWCMYSGIQVTNNSYGSSGDPGQTVEDAFNDTYYDYGIIHVAAAGNGGSVIFPAAYDSVIAVSATDEGDNLADFSSTGVEVELAAPGVDIYSTYKDGGYATYSGTSMASPHVAGVAALVWEADPLLSNNGVRTQLQSTAENIGLSTTEQGDGLVDAAEAVVVDTDTMPPAKVTDLTVATVSCVQLNLVWDPNTEGDLDHYNVYRSTNSGGSYDLVASPTTYSYSDVGLTISTTYYYKVSAVDVSGNEGLASDKAYGTTNADDLGPLTSDVVADPNPTNGAAFVTLTADVSDATTCNSNIAAAEYFVGTVGTNGNGITMSALDGAFNFPTEEVTATMDVSGWAVGQYTLLYVHGQDAASNWGATESVVLNVTEESSDTMHVFSIDMSFKIAGINVNAIAAVTIMDISDNILVEGAIVSGHWSGATSDSDSGVTDVNGQVSLESDKVKNPISGTTFTFTVDNVTSDVWTYDPTANVETSNSIIVP